MPSIKLYRLSTQPSPRIRSGALHSGTPAGRPTLQTASPAMSRYSGSRTRHGSGRRSSSAPITHSGHQRQHKQIAKQRLPDDRSSRSASVTGSACHNRQTPGAWCCLRVGTAVVRRIEPAQAPGQGQKHRSGCCHRETGSQRRERLRSRHQPEAALEGQRRPEVHFRKTPGTGSAHRPPGAPRSTPAGCRCSRSRTVAPRCHAARPAVTAAAAGAAVRGTARHAGDGWSSPHRR
jgi:hypothetical protein